ncbi:hypothetical protein D3C71_1708620 [compost metagenome]
MDQMLDLGAQIVKAQHHVVEFVMEFLADAEGIVAPFILLQPLHNGGDGLLHMQIQKIGDGEGQKNQKGQTEIKQIPSLDNRGMDYVQGHVVEQIGVQRGQLHIA